MKKNVKNFIIFMMAMCMTVTGSVTVHAAGPEEATGTGTLEGTIPTDIFQIVLPTDVDDVFDFILDPQELINMTNGAAYGGKKFEEDATLFFKRTDDEAGNDYSSTSDAITIINKSSVPVDVTVTAGFSPDSLGGITMTDDESFTGDTSASMYLAMIDGENTVRIQGEDDTSIQVTIPAAEDAYEYRYDSEKDQYTYGLKEDLSGIEFPEYSFWLTGAVNKNGNWQDVGNVKPEIVVTWVVTPAEWEEEPKERREEEEAPSQNSEEEIPETVSDDTIELEETLSDDEGFASVPETKEEIPEAVSSEALDEEETPLTESKPRQEGTDFDFSPKEKVPSEEDTTEKEDSSDGEEEKPETEGTNPPLLEDNGGLVDEY